MAGNTINQKGLIWPDRRKFLKRASLVCAGAGALAALPTVVSAKLLRGPANPSVTNYSPSQPAPAATWSYNTLAFFDDFNSLASIDLNATVGAGFKWYTRVANTGGPVNTLPASEMSANGSILTINDSHGGFDISTLGTTGASVPYGVIGQTFPAGGAYFEAKFAFNAPPSPTSIFPNFFIFDKDITLLHVNGGSWPANGLAEVDFMEALYSGTGSPSLSLNNWTHYGTSTVYSNPNNVPNVGASYPNDGLMHSYGCLLVPASKNGGTGLIRRYVDGVLQTNCNVTYTAGGVSPEAPGAPSGWMSCLDTTAGLQMYIGGGKNWPLYVDSVQVWQ